MYLLDVNLLIALAWPSHVHHPLAQAWFAQNRHRGWATCPITQLGFVRISSNPQFIDGAVSPGEAIKFLRQVTNAKDHSFWPDALNVTEANQMPQSNLLGHRQVTDVYLLALVIAQKGKLATLDGGVSALLPRAELRAKHIEVLS